MAKTMTPSTERTQEQERKFVRLMEDIAKHATAVVLGKVSANRKEWQRALEKGDQIREVVTEAVIAKVSEFCASRLRYIKSILAPASEKLVITEKLLRERYNFGWFGENFQRLFFGKTLEKVAARTIAIHQLKEYSTSQQIKEELAEQAVTFFAYALSLVEKQRKGENGLLLTNGYSNILIVEVAEEVEENGKKVIKKTFWAVNFYWHSDYGAWDVGARPVEDPLKWSDGSQILSCDSEPV